MAQVRAVFTCMAFTLLLFISGMAQAGTVQGDSGDSPGNLIDVARQAGHFNTFVQALQQADILDELEGKGPYTIFAPTDDAFAGMPGPQRDRLFSPEHVDDLKTMLHYHIVPGRIPAREAGAVSHVQALTQQIYIRQQGDRLTINDAHVVIPEIKARNGILYGIDKVLIPHFQEVFSPHPESQ